VQGDKTKHSYFLLHGIARFQLIQSAQVQDGICLQISDMTENLELNSVTHHLDIFSVSCDTSFKP